MRRLIFTKVVGSDVVSSLTGIREWIYRCDICGELFPMSLGDTQMVRWLIDHEDYHGLSETISQPVGSH